MSPNEPSLSSSPPSSSLQEGPSSSSTTTTTSTTCNTTNNNNNNNHATSKLLDVILKPKYVLDAPHPCLAPTIAPSSTEATTTSSNTTTTTNHQKTNRHKQNVKNSQKRSRETTLSDLKMCKQLMVGNQCPFGDNCKYSHDIKELLSMRQDDIPGVKGGCPHYRIHGKCPYGIACRVGGEHLNLATGENLPRQVKTEREEEGDATHQQHPPPHVMNNLDYSVLVSLRKKKYPFVCQRHVRGTSKSKQNHDVNNTTDSNSNSNSNSNGNSDTVEEELKHQNDNVHVEEHGQDDVKQEEPTAPTARSTSTTLKTTTTDQAMDLSPLPKMKKLIDFRNKVYVAPLTTVGNLPFRRVMKRYGADITCGEMAVAFNLLQGKAGEWALLKRHKDEDVFGIQIAAPHGDVYERISELIKNENIEIDFLDMNLGCPIDVICKTGAGARLMQRDHNLRDAIKGMGKHLSCPITVKIRTGWDENKPFAHNLVPKIQKWAMGNVGAVMVHGRSRLQRYSKLADWDYIQKVANSQSCDLERLPIIGNGDIFSYVDYEEKVLGHEALSPTAMIGRGALIKPWLPTEIKERRHWDISATERLDILKDFVSFGLEHWGSDTHGVNTTRRFLLEWLSFLCRYVPVGLLEESSIPQQMNQRPPRFMCGRSDLETLMMSGNSADWIKISEMLLGPVGEGFEFQPKHKATSYK
eukprot:CAMPEP_0176477360 /NCGR_PEP_ID=MMETSP0200_2-20121128/579_1 /TAXON_ID=947934 /ORGANISM="Chaetoceros sp., Strain GSL56" /LENGTH=693 /DNA_ID=CAMNT_0017873161 /DNA_START=267 /DNA_END=2348 /DNA_ORIENTATION=-